jgi:3-(3-hydroxy-phenyl)propionate hydroxylase
VRDAHNLAWKLAAVVQGHLGEDLLGTYEQERLPHARALIQLAVNMGRIMMPTSKVQASLVQSGFRIARLLPPIQDYFAQMKYKPKPFYKAGFIASNGMQGLVGRMAPQPILECGPGRQVLLDDLIGNEFAVISYGPDAQDTAERVGALDFGLPRLRRIAVLPMRYNADGTGNGTGAAGRDIEDRFSRVGTANRDIVLVVRPDRYIAAAADGAKASDLDAMAASVRDLVKRSWASPAATERESGILERRPAA